MSFDYKSEIINELHKERNALSHRVGELEATLERVKALMENRYVATFAEVIGPCIDLERTNKLRKELESAVKGESSKPDCDMVDTDLCKHYQKKPECHYYSTHYVKCTRGNPHEPPT